MAVASYYDSRLNEAPPGGIFERHTHLYDRHVNPPPTGQPLPQERYGYRGYYYIKRDAAPLSVDITSVNDLPSTPNLPTVIYRRPFNGAVDCLIWVMGMGRKFGELQLQGDRFVLKRSTFECLPQSPVKAIFGRGTLMRLPTIETVERWREDYPWELNRWGLLEDRR